MGVRHRGDATKAANCGEISGTAWPSLTHIQTTPGTVDTRLLLPTVDYTGLHCCAHYTGLHCSDAIKAIYRLNASSSTPQWARRKLQ